MTPPRAEAERARLREALETLVGGFQFIASEARYEFVGSTFAINGMIDSARAALDETKGVRK